MVSDYLIKIVYEEQSAHSLKKRSKASAKEREERTAKNSAQKEKQEKEKSERRFDMDPPSLRCLLCDAFIFFWEGGDQRWFSFIFSFFFFPCFFFFPLGRRRSEVVFFCTTERSTFFVCVFVFLHFSSSWRAKTRRGFLFATKR